MWTKNDKFGFHHSVTSLCASVIRSRGSPGFSGWHASTERPSHMAEGEPRIWGGGRHARGKGGGGRKSHWLIIMFSLWSSVFWFVRKQNRTVFVLHHSVCSFSLFFFSSASCEQKQKEEEEEAKSPNRQWEGQAHKYEDRKEGEMELETDPIEHNTLTRELAEF